MKQRRVLVAMAALLGGPLAVSAPAPAQNLELQIVDKDCWVEIYEDDKYDADDPHVRLEGEQALASLKNLAGRDWNNDIESLIVGPNATVKAYSKKDFEGTEIGFTPDQRIADLSKLKMANEIESMKVSCARK